MIVNDIVTGIIAVIIGYLLGSIPSAYIVTRIVTGRDIRQAGGGNVGARNTYVQAGLPAAVIVGIFDVGKGAVAVAIARWLLLDRYSFFVLASGLAVVAGHMWSIYLKFIGGNGLATTMGVLSVLLPRELLIALAIALGFIAITRNPVISLNISLISVPVSAWFLEKSWPLFVFPIVLIIMMGLHFFPTAKSAMVEAGSRENFFGELLRRKKVK